jgi:sugar phosphate isomerase/epimerase
MTMSKRWSLRYAICNELFEGWDFAEVCRTARSLGYEALEVAPFTLASLITELSGPRRAELRRIAETEGTPVLGLHWLLAKTTGFMVTSPDPAVRQRTADYLAELTRGCADLGGKLMVFGSPASRKVPEGHTAEQALDLAADTFRRVTPALDEYGVDLCLEPLGPAETDFLRTAAETRELIRRIDHLKVVLHLDVKAMSTEPSPIPEVIAANRDLARHFHANDPNLRGPGMGDVNFVPIFRALREIEYMGFVSVEVFDFKPDPVTVARESIDYMKAVEERVTTERQ